jgi:hypothetical protein
MVALLVSSLAQMAHWVGQGQHIHHPQGVRNSSNNSSSVVHPLLLQLQRQLRQHYNSKQQSLRHYTRPSKVPRQSWRRYGSFTAS